MCLLGKEFGDLLLARMVRGSQGQSVSDAALCGEQQPAVMLYVLVHSCGILFS